MSNETLIAKYEGLLKSRPDDELIRFSLGKALFDARRLDESEAQLQAALNLKPDWMVVTILLAKIALLRGDKVTARGLFEKGLELAITQHHDDPADECRAELARLD
jgi:Flp pilus assembly protein TadD